MSTDGREARHRRRLIRSFLRRGIPVVPLAPRSKRPVAGYSSRNAIETQRKAARFFSAHPQANYGLVAGPASGLMIIDVDSNDGELALEALKHAHGRLPKTVWVVTGRVYHLFFRVPQGISVRNCKLGKDLDCKGDGGYVVGPGSVHPTGARYRFQRGQHIWDCDIAMAPDWLIKLAAKPSERSAEPRSTKLGVSQPYAEAALRGELATVKAAKHGERNGTLNRTAFRLGQLAPVLDKETVVSALRGVAAKVGLTPGDAARTIESGWLAGVQHPRKPPATQNTEREDADRLAAPDEDTLTNELAELGETDADNGRRFARRYADQVLYTPGRGFLLYDGTRWRSDDLRKSFMLAEEAARQIGAEANYLQGQQERARRVQFAQASLSKGALERMLELAKSHLSIEDKQLDANPWVLNVLNGTIDLRTGELRPHDPQDRITMLAPVGFDPKAKCPTFKRVIKQALKGDKDLIGYFQKAVGYTLSGDISEQVFLFTHGPSKTSKSTVLNCLREMLGDYGIHTPTETLLAKQYDNAIPADLARLAGARMVTAIEANWNRQIDEARIKALTGGEPVTARFMRQNYFEFQPEFKLWFAANDFPRVRDTGGAFWERVRVIPFEVQIALEDRDKALSAKLRAEWPEILAWAVRGCLKWQREGLQVPDAVQRATNLWKKGADHLKRFVDEEVILEDKGVAQASALYRHYTAWCQRNGETPLSNRVIKARLPEFDIIHKRVNGRSIWKGVKLKL